MCAVHHPRRRQVPHFKPGDSLEGGRFVIVRQIGRGGMGTVYLAQDTVLGTLVALKISDPAIPPPFRS